MKSPLKYFYESTLSPDSCHKKLNGLHFNMLSPIDYSISKFTSFTDDKTMESIREITAPIRYKKDAVIESRGDPSDHLFIVEDGLVQLGINGADGSRFNLTRLGKGHTFGESAFFLRTNVLHDAHAFSDVIARKLSSADIDFMMRRSVNFSNALIAVACMRVQTTLSYIGDKLNMSLNTRVAKQILSVSASTNHSSVVNLRQVDLAHALGVSRVSIGKSLKELQSQGLIEIGYGKLKIISKNRLMGLIN